MSGLGPAWHKALDEWAAWSRASGHSENTIKLRLKQLRVFAGAVGDDPWAVTLGQMVVYIGNPDWNVHTRHSVRQTLRSFFAFATVFEYMPADPSEKLPKVPQPVRQPRPTPNEVFANALARADDRLRLVLMLAAYAGLRRAEIAALRWEHVADGLLRVKGKGSKTRVIPIHPALAAELDAEAQRRREGRYGTGYRYRPTCDRGYVFPGRYDGHAEITALGQAVGRLLGHGYSMHTLRHRFATRAYAGQRDLLAVQALLGHSSAETTRVYAGIPPDALEAAVLAAGGGDT